MSRDVSAAGGSGSGRQRQRPAAAEAATEAAAAEAAEAEAAARAGQQQGQRWGESYASLSGGRNYRLALFELALFDLVGAIRPYLAHCWYSRSRKSSIGRVRPLVWQRWHTPAE